MFVDALERVNLFTRPIHSITRLYNNTAPTPGTSTLFFVNEEGCAVTCKHVAELFLKADDIHNRFRRFQGALKPLDREKNSAHLVRKLEENYKLTPETIVRVRNTFIDCVDVYKQLHIHLHPTQDLAILRFEGYNRRLYQSRATFLGDTSRAKPGRTLCRTGYPFPEFNNYRYNPALDDIEWTTEGKIDSPSFPTDGIITRIIRPNGVNTLIEMSTPGLLGQSGGPLFDTNGLIFGMQASTRHLHLGFDIEDREVMVKGRRIRVSNYQFMNVGQCIHVDVIKAFLRENDVRFFEG